MPETDRPWPWLVVVKEYPILDELLGRHFFIQTAIAATNINVRLQEASAKVEELVDRLQLS